MGWLEKLTNWLRETLAAIVEGVTDFLHDAGVWVFEQLCTVVVIIADAIPVPDFLTEYSVDSLLSAIDIPLFWWAFDKFQIPALIGMFAAAVAFNLLRKLLTLGQW